jgi:hypothetical protein
LTVLTGLSEKKHVMLKKMMVKINKGMWSRSSDKKGLTPISKETVPALGMENKGPIAK